LENRSSSEFFCFKIDFFDELFGEANIMDEEDLEDVLAPPPRLEP
jgi:hypothetical protein